MFVLMHEKDNSILANEYISTLDYENQHEEEREFEMVFIFIIRELVHKSTMTKKNSSSILKHVVKNY